MSSRRRARPSSGRSTGVHHHVDPLVGTKNNSCGPRMTSRHLFMSVEESTVIFGPICHVGGRRLGDRDAGELVALAAAERSTDAVITGGRVRRHRCGQGTGGWRSAPSRSDEERALGAARRLDHRRAGDERLLVGQCQAPHSRAAKGHGQPGETHHGVDHDVGGLGGGHQPLLAGEHLGAGRKRRARSAASDSSPMRPARGGAGPPGRRGCRRTLAARA